MGVKSDPEKPGQKEFKHKKEKETQTSKPSSGLAPTKKARRHRSVLGDHPGDKTRKTSMPHHESKPSKGHSKSRKQKG